jgi:sugar lactone lactonase YvrE
VNAEFGLSEFLSPSGTTDLDFAAKLLRPGSSGLGIDPATRQLITCEHGNRRVTARRWVDEGYLDTVGSNGALFSQISENITVLASTYNGVKLNSPNDLVFAPNGDMLFTDPTMGLRPLVPSNNSDSGTNRSHSGQDLQFSGIFLIPAVRIAAALSRNTEDESSIGQKEPKLILLDGTMQAPHGLAFSPDG